MVAGLAIGLLGLYFRLPEVSAERPSHDKATSGGELITISAQLPDGRQQITLIDPLRHVMSVYHIDSTNGGIQLRSVRNVRWDMLLDEFNGNRPSPREIHSLLDR